MRHSHILGNLNSATKCHICLWFSAIRPPLHSDKIEDNNCESRYQTASFPFPRRWQRLLSKELGSKNRWIFNSNTISILHSPATEFRRAVWLIADPFRTWCNWTPFRPKTGKLHRPIGGDHPSAHHTTAYVTPLCDTDNNRRSIAWSWSRARTLSSDFRLRCQSTDRSIHLQRALCQTVILVQTPHKRALSHCSFSSDWLKWARWDTPKYGLQQRQREAPRAHLSTFARTSRNTDTSPAVINLRIFAR